MGYLLGLTLVAAGVAAVLLAPAGFLVGGLVACGGAGVLLREANG